MKLYIDIGNSYIKWTYFDNKDSEQYSKIFSCELNDLETLISSQSFITHDKTTLNNAAPNLVEAIYIASVSHSSKLEVILQYFQNLEFPQPILLQTQSQWRGLKNAYTKPERMGVDRWLVLMAAWKEAQHACLVIDCGTAITLDAIDNKGQHLGGYIVPGLNLLKSTITGSTAKVRFFEGESISNESIWGDSTSNAVNLGCEFMVLDFIKGRRERFLKQFPKSQLFITGGDGLSLAKQLNLTDAFDEYLLFKGMVNFAVEELT